VKNFANGLAATCQSQKSRQGYNPPTRSATEVAMLVRRSNPGPDPWRIRPLRLQIWCPVHSGLQGARRGQSWHRRPVDPKGPIERRRRTWTHSSTNTGRRVRMLLSFQRPSHLCRKGLLLSGTPASRIESRGRPISIAPEHRVAKLSSDILTRPSDWAAPSRSNIAPAEAESLLWVDRRRSRPPTRPFAAAAPAARQRPRPGVDHDRTLTVTVRCRGRSSKSSSTSCCQVPSARRPSISGIVSEGPISAARRCACALVSWFRRLCS
jgi:hypothetical protein